MYDNIFSDIKNKIDRAGTDDPREVAQFFDIMWIPLRGTITGYAASYSSVYAIGVNERLNGIWLRFAAWHELTHIFAGHVSAGSLPDRTCFAQEVDSLNIPKHERTANLVSADICVDDDAVLEVTNYNSDTIRSYRSMRSYQEKLVRDFDALRISCDRNYITPVLKSRMHDLSRRINSVSLALNDMDGEINSLNCCRTFHEMSLALGINDRILRYKLEAMRLRGFDIDRQELESYSKMFEGSIAYASQKIL